MRRLILPLLIAVAAGAPAPQALARQGGELSFEKCELPVVGTRPSNPLNAECTTLEVPENWDDAASRKIKLAIALVPSRSPKPKSDPVFILAGGPGQSARESWRMLAGTFKAVLTDRHVVLLDQRGTGASNRFDCPTPENIDPLAVDIDPEQAAELARACVAAVKETHDVRFYSTENAARDLDHARQALGAEQLNLVGISYGTRMGQIYTKRYAERVRSLLLDSVVPNELILGSEHAANLEDALKAQLGRCRDDVECGKKFGDPYVSLRELAVQLRTNPRMVSVSAASTVSVTASVGNVGDMTKAVYDTDNGGVVDNSEALGGVAASGFVQTGNASWVDLTDGGATSLHSHANDHARQHSITSTSDHTSTATSGQMLQADANGLPVNATNTDAQGSAAASHAAVTVADTASIDMTLTGQQISAAAIFGTGAGVVAEGNHTHYSYYSLQWAIIAGYIQKNNEDNLKDKFKGLDMKFENADKHKVITQERNMKAKLDGIEEQISNEKALPSDKQNLEKLKNLEGTKTIAEGDYLKFVNQQVNVRPELSKYFNNSIQPAQLKGKKKQIPSDMALLSYLPGETQLYIFIATSDTVIAKVVNIPRTQIIRNVNAVLNLVRSSQGTFNKIDLNSEQVERQELVSELNQPNPTLKPFEEL